MCVCVCGLRSGSSLSSDRDRTRNMSFRMKWKIDVFFLILGYIPMFGNVGSCINYSISF